MFQKHLYNTKNKDNYIYKKYSNVNLAKCYRNKVETFQKSETLKSNGRTNEHEHLYIVYILAENYEFMNILTYIGHDYRDASIKILPRCSRNQCLG